MMGPQTQGLLWPYFAAMYKSVRNRRPEDFSFTPGQTPLASTQEVVTALVIYYTIIFGGREVMKNQTPWKLPTLFKIHNFCLTAISAVLLILHLEQLVPLIWSKGLLFSICQRSGGWESPLPLLYYLNYLTKYLEFLDTLFLVLRKKRLTVLHTYHHGATALLCYTQLAGRTPISWVPITLNLAVHVVMYWYYFQAARGIKIWWKKYITTMQILQFVLDLGFIYFAFWTEAMSRVVPHWNMPHMGLCEGDHWSAWWGISIISSYLVLFVGFYISTYTKAVSEKLLIFGMTMW